MRLKIRCDGWKRKYFGYASEVNAASMPNDCTTSAAISEYSVFISHMHKREKKPRELHKLSLTPRAVTVLQAHNFFPCKKTH
jgi:hypothetical protein